MNIRHLFSELNKMYRIEDVDSQNVSSTEQIHLLNYFASEIDLWKSFDNYNRLVVVSKYVGSPNEKKEIGTGPENEDTK